MRIRKPTSIALLVMTLIIGCETPEKQQLPADEMVIKGLYYADGKPIAVSIRDGMISGISREMEGSEGLDHFLGPGLIDHQVNGYLGHSFVGGTLSAVTFNEIMEGFWANGITSFLPTFTTQTNEQLTRGFEILDSLLQDKHLSQSIPGFHLEGPYISPEPGFRGAHNPEWIRKPDWQEFEAWQAASGNRILQVTVAPEVEGAMDFIKKCRDQGVVVAIGHTGALADDINQAITLGASISTHLGNGCANTIHRHHNPLWPQLADDRLAASLIADGFHLTREEVRTFVKAKGTANTLLVSDLIRLAGLPPGKYRDLGRELVMTEEGAIMVPEENVLAGASFLITRGIENVIKFTGCSLPEAIDMASKNPARVLGLRDRGEIAEGLRADLVLFTFDNGKFEVLKTIVGGEEVFENR